MTSLRVLTLALATLPLMGCGGFLGIGDLSQRSDPIPEGTKVACLHPAQVILGETNAEVMVRKLGDELLVCELKRANAVAGLEDFDATFR